MTVKCTTQPVHVVVPAGRREVPPDERRKVHDASRMLLRLFGGYPGHAAMRLWEGTTLPMGSTGSAPPAFTLVFRNPNAVAILALKRDRLRLADAYLHGDIDIEGDFFKALALSEYLQASRLTWPDRLRVVPPAVRLSRAEGRIGFRSSAIGALPRSEGVKPPWRSASRAAAPFLCDPGNAFYALWLDRSMAHSCARFSSDDEVLEDAQTAELDGICRKLQLKPQDRLLDIGCGWGALLLHAARHYGVEAHGLTLSGKQLAATQAQIARAGLEHRVTAELRDDRDLDGAGVYDKIASVGMFEQSGSLHPPACFARVHRLLKPGGLFLSHGITRDLVARKATLSTQFSERYIFPPGPLDTVSELQRAMEAKGFEIEDVESLRHHCALTLRDWVARLVKHHAESLQHVSEATYRAWQLYMSACTLEFESGEMGMYQFLATRRSDGPHRT